MTTKEEKVKDLKGMEIRKRSVYKSMGSKRYIQ
jgi:hypothetical protein